MAASVSHDAAAKIVQSLSIRSVSELKELTGDKGGEEQQMVEWSEVEELMVVIRARMSSFLG